MNERSLRTSLMGQGSAFRRRLLPWVLPVARVRAAVGSCQGGHVLFLPRAEARGSLVCHERLWHARALPSVDLDRFYIFLPSVH